MEKTAIVYTPNFSLHEPGVGHPEAAWRARVVAEALLELDDDQGARLEWLKPEPAAERWVEEVLTPEYRRFVERSWKSGRAILDIGDTRVSDASYGVALYAVGAGMRAVDAVLLGACANAFSCARPPGHHARRSQAMGFCLFNNVAVAARYAQRRHGLERILIVDWDVHHGNGTEETFYHDPSVFFFSIHQWPFYPGSGGANSTGAGRGEGFTLNVPVEEGARGEDYLRAFHELLVPAADEFDPDLVLISSGFDAHREDPLASVELEDEDFAQLTRIVMGIAARHCKGRVVSLLEGGYHSEAVARSAVHHVRALNRGSA